MVKTARLCLSALITPFGVLAAQSSASPAKADVPIAKVVLFSSGVGYFEHFGTVHGNSATQLRFKTSQINDILKSIMLQDQDGGRIGAITYPSQDPLSKTLKSFQIDITQNPSQADLLNQLRGARVTIQAKGASMSGTIIGVETQKRSAEKGGETQVAVLNLLAGATIRAVELPSITSLVLEDPQLQDELSKALSALVQARDQDKKPVTINFAGTGDRHVRIGYVVETPIWKTSYRLLLNDKGTSGTLQGWAIVENQTESDWNNVSLNLVSGRPISFMMNLYQPLYSQRPTVAQETIGSIRPQVYDGGVTTMARADSGRIQLRGSSSLAGRVPGVTLSEIVVTGMGDDPPADYAASISSVATTSKLGELFQYTVGNVTLARQKSAMLPIITDTVDLERVSIYNAAVLGSNPLNGVLFKNTTGKHLLQGPLTVLDGGGYAGDARIDNVPPGQTRLLSYGVDLDVTVNPNGGIGTSNITSARISKGLMILTRKVESSRSYALENKSDKSKTIVFEHPVERGSKLVETQAPFETTASVYRFKVPLPAGKLTYFVVKEERPYSESLMLTSMEAPQLLGYSRTSGISQEVRDAFAKAGQFKQAVTDVDRLIAAASQQIAEITVEQNRIRENMKTVEKSGQYYERLLSKLNEQESQIEKLQSDRAALVTRRDAARRELEEYLNGLTIG